MDIYFIELRDERMGIASQKVNGIMLPILAVWSELMGWKAEVDFIDINGVDYEKECDVVGISTYTYLASSSFIVAERFRKRGKIVVIGGPHTKCRTEETRDHADVVFGCCNEESWHKFLRAVESREITASGDRGIFIPSPEMRQVPPYADYKKFYGDDKIPMLISSLGCAHTCDFCMDWDSNYYKRDVDETIEDIRNVDSDIFVFCDPNFAVNEKLTSQLLRKMIPLKKKYLMETSLRFLLKDEFLELLRDSGCMGIEIGIESLSTTYEKNVAKGADSLMENTIHRIRKIKKYIPFVQVNIVFGLDGDTEETFHSVVELHRLSNIDTIVPHIATPFPGTPFWDRMQEEGRIIVSDERYYNTQNLVISLKNLAPSHFYDLYIDVLKKINFPLVVLKKPLDHFRESKSMKMAFFLFLFLLRRVRNTFFYDIPALRRAKKWWVRREAEDGGKAPIKVGMR